MNRNLSGITTINYDPVEIHGGSMTMDTSSKHGILYTQAEMDQRGEHFGGSGYQNHPQQHVEHELQPLHHHPHLNLQQFPPHGEYNTHQPSNSTDKLSGRSTYGLIPVVTLIPSSSETDPSSTINQHQIQQISVCQQDSYSNSTTVGQMYPPGGTFGRVDTIGPGHCVVQSSSTTSPGHISNQSYTSSEGSIHPKSNLDGLSKRSHGGESSSYHHHHHRKKKRLISMMDTTTDMDDDSETCSSRRTITPTDETSKKQNHSEIEKRRRDKMNTYITELAGMVPVGGVISRKLDKLTVLRMAVQHMKTIRGTQLHSYTEGHYKPSYISDAELKHLILQAAEGFLFVVGCDRGRLLYVSESVSNVLNYTQSELLGQSWFDILHPKDIAKVKEQLNDLAPRERLFIDIRTMLPVKGNSLQHHWGNRLCPGARRSFFCRMKCKPGIQVKEEVDESCATSGSGGNSGADTDESYGSQSPKKSMDNAKQRKYSVVYCTGYMKPWPKSEMEDREGGEIDDTCNLSCLIAVGRILPALSNSSLTDRPISFTSRHALDGKFVFVDQRATLVLGFLPQELIGTSMYEFYHQDDIPKLAETHKTVLASSGDPILTPVYRFRMSDSTYASLRSSWKAFRNPWTRDVECLIATNNLVSSDPDNAESVEVTARATTLSSEQAESYNQAQCSRTYAYYDDDRETDDELGKRNRKMDDLLAITTHCNIPKYLNRKNSLARSVSGEGGRDLSPNSSPSGHTQEQGSIGNLIPSLMSVCESEDLRPLVTPVSISNYCIAPSSSTPNTCNDNSITLTNLTPIGQSLIQQQTPQYSNLCIQDLVMNTTTQNRISPRPPPLLTGPTNPHRSLAILLNESIEENEMMYMMGDHNGVLQGSGSPDPTNHGDGNDEAAMAVIMSLLEADAGLNVPADLSGLPWSLS